MAIYDQEPVEAAFWFTFAGFALPHRPDAPTRDLDLASYGAVAVCEPGNRPSWEPKQVFHAIAQDFEGRRTT